MMVAFEELLRRSWPVFLDAIRSGRTLTYSEFSGLVGPPLTRRQVHRQFLNPLSVRCRASGLPDLCALIVRKDTGRPGGGWNAASPSADPDRDWAEAVAECFGHPWPSRPEARLLREP